MFIKTSTIFFWHRLGAYGKGLDSLQTKGGEGCGEIDWFHRAVADRRSLT